MKKVPAHSPSNQNMESSVIKCLTVVMLCTCLTSCDVLLESLMSHKSLSESAEEVRLEKRAKQELEEAQKIYQTEERVGKSIDQQIKEINKNRQQQTVIRQEPI